MSDNALIIFVKNPELGKVKTRLAKTIGHKAALDIYKKLITYTQKETTGAHADLIIYYSAHMDKGDEWRNVQRKLQTAGDLGLRMSKAFEVELNQYKKVCIIGTDCAELTASHINEAFVMLDGNDFVLGPANDGGYYLLGMKQFEASIFENVVWSTDRVLKQTIDQIGIVKGTFQLLPELIDVDTIDDWEKVRDNFVQ